MTCKHNRNVRFTILEVDQSRPRAGAIVGAYQENRAGLSWCLDCGAICRWVDPSHSLDQWAWELPRYAQKHDRLESFEIKTGKALEEIDKKIKALFEGHSELLMNKAGVGVEHSLRALASELSGIIKRIEKLEGKRDGRRKARKASKAR